MDNEEIKTDITTTRFHTIFDCSQCNVGSFNKNNITLFGKDVAFLIGSEVYGPPAIGTFDNGTKDETGIFHAQFFEKLTHISGHYTEDGNAYIDLITRNPINVEQIQNLLNQYFQPTFINIGYIARYA